MPKKYLILPLLIAVRLFDLVYNNGDVSVFDIIMNIAVTALMWGIFIWGVHNPEAKR